MTWFFPLSSRLTAADVPRVEAGIAALASSPAMRKVEVAAGGSVLADTAISTGLADGLATFNSQWHTTTGVDSVLVVGLFVVGVVLLLICCGLAAQAYRPELVLLRVRGGSVRQVARRMFARSCCIVLLPIAAGVALAVAVLPGGGSSALLVGLTALAAVTAMPLICMLQHRRLRLGAVSPRVDAVGGRSSVRRLTGELAVLLVAAATLADLRLRGAGQQAGGSGGTTSIYLSASAVLVAAAVALVLNRAYRGPLRLLAGAASIRRGAVGAVGFARAAGTRVRVRAARSGADARPDADRVQRDGAGLDLERSAGRIVGADRRGRGDLGLWHVVRHPASPRRDRADARRDARDRGLHGVRRGSGRRGTQERAAWAARRDSSGVVAFLRGPGC